MLTIAPGGRNGIFLGAPEGEKFALLVEGEVPLTLGDEVHILRAGDAITFVPAIHISGRIAVPDPPTW